MPDHFSGRCTGFQSGKQVNYQMALQTFKVLSSTMPVYLSNLIQAAVPILPGIGGQLSR